MTSLGAALDPAGRPRKPGLLCIGAQKAGTSWLAQMLDQHPGLWIPPLKEVQYFNHRFMPQHRRWIAWHYRQKPQEIRERHARRGLAMPADLDAYLTGLTRGKMFHNHWYKRVFAPAPADALPVDVTPEYSTIPAEGVDYVARFLPRARIVYLIRHPVDRAVSQLRMNLQRENRRPETLADWMREIDDPVLHERGDYATYLPRWQARYPDMLVLPFGLIARDPAGVLRRIEAFCALLPHDYQEPGTKVFANPDPLPVPEEALAALALRLEPQVWFIARTLGAEFLSLTR